MKKTKILLILQLVLVVTISAQNVSNYKYILDNGITVKTEKGWRNNVDAFIKYDSLKLNEQPKISVSISGLGDLILSSSYSILKDGVETKKFDPATYAIKVLCKLTGTSGTISFDVTDIILKPKMKTSVFLSVYDVKINIQENPANLKGLSYYESKVNRFKDNWEQNLNWGIPTFYLTGKHEKSVKPDEPGGDYYGKIKSGKYDLKITINISGFNYKIWLENFEMKPDKNYKISTNLNGGQIVYKGGNYEVKVLHLYPSGTASKFMDKPVHQPKLQIIGYEPATNAFACPPGIYDVLLNFGNGVKYEWRKNIKIDTGSKVEVK